MSRATESSKPTFLWQAVLILLLIVVLAAMGWYSLRQDKRHAENEAAQRAAAIAEELLPKLWAEVNARPEKNTGRPMFRVNLFGELVFPAPHNFLPAPAPLNDAELDAPARRLWSDAHGNSDPASASA